MVTSIVPVEIFDKNVPERDRIVIRSTEWAFADCGCTAAAGIRLDKDEPAVAWTPCGYAGHLQLIARARELHAATLTTPRAQDAGKPTLDVAVEMLDEVYGKCARCGVSPCRCASARVGSVMR